MLETKFDTRKTALLVIDCQNDLIKAEEEPFNAVTRMVEKKGMIGKIASLIAAARKAKMPVIFIGHVHRRDNADVVPSITDFMLQGMMPPAKGRMVEGTPGAQIVAELKLRPDDHVIWKRRSNAFASTDLELRLRTLGIDTVILTGAVTNGCVANTCRGARERDLHVIAVSDCCATQSAEDDDYFMQRVFPREGRVRTAAEVLKAISGGKK